jgi:hypothetical protein
MTLHASKQGYEGGRDESSAAVKGAPTPNPAAPALGLMVVEWPLDATKDGG